MKFETHRTLGPEDWEWDGWKWTAKLPYTHLCYDHKKPTCSFSHGDGHDVVLTVECGPYPTIYTFSIPEGALWMGMTGDRSSVSTTDPRYPRRPSVSQHKCHLMLTLVHADTERRKQALEQLMFAADEDDLAEVLSILKFESQFGKLKLTPPYTIFEYVRSDEVAAALAVHVSRSEMVDIINRFFRFSWSSPCLGRTSPGMTMVGQVEGCALSRPRYIHMWPSVVSKFGLTALDFKTFPEGGPGARYDVYYDVYPQPLYGRKGSRRAEINAEIKRTKGRLERIKRELMEKTWHPARMVRWCLDTEEIDALRGI